MIGTILLEGLEIECIVGIYPFEREKEQVLMVDLEIDRDFAAAAASDAVEDTVDYVALAALLTELAQRRKYKLLETFAEEAAAALIKEFGARRALVKIMKPGAVKAASWPAVRVERRA